jgi:hypothetical protein
MRRRYPFLWGTIFLACIGATFAWYTVLNSREVQLARDYVLRDEDFNKKYSQVTNSTLVGVRLSLSNGGHSYCSFWLSTRQGRKFITVKIDKNTYPWSLKEVEGS